MCCTFNFLLSEKCDGLPNLASMELKSLTDFNVKYGQNVTLACSPGFSLTGDKVIRCVKNREFVYNEIPNCVQGKSLYGHEIPIHFLGPFFESFMCSDVPLTSLWPNFGAISGLIQCSFHASLMHLCLLSQHPLTGVRDWTGLDPIRSSPTSHQEEEGAPLNLKHICCRLSCVKDTSEMHEKYKARATLNPTTFYFSDP